MYLYETHLHTMPVSKCARADAKEVVEFYKSLGYSGIFITNHFIDGNINIDKTAPYKEKIEFYFSDYELAKELGEKNGLDVFLGIEMSYGGTDFLVYGLDKEWFLSHPEIESMKKSDELAFMASEGALIIQAHPFREAAYIDHIRLFPRRVHGVEIYNADRTDFENGLAKQYSDNYSLLHFAGSDNHVGKSQIKLGGMSFSSPIKNEADFVTRIKSGDGSVFCKNLESDG